MSPAPSFRIRLATDDDGPVIGALIAGVFAEYENCPFVVAEFPELAAVASHFRDRGGQLFAAERDRRLIGCAGVAPGRRGDLFTLHKVYLAAEERGTGVAARLLDAVTDFARARGARQLRLFSDTRFARGHAFYEKHGYRRLPGLRLLHDAADSVEFFFGRDIEGPAP